MVPQQEVNYVETRNKYFVRLVMRRGWVGAGQVAQCKSRRLVLHVTGMTSHGRDLKIQYSIVISDHYQRLPVQSRMPTAQRSSTTVFPVLVTKVRSFSRRLTLSNE